MALALLPIPCIVVAPVALVAIAVVVPLWIGALLLTGVIRILVSALDAVAQRAGIRALGPPRAALARWWHVLANPKFPERWRSGRS